MPDKLFSDPPPGTPIPDPEYRRSIRWRLLILYLADVLVIVLMFIYLSYQDAKIEQQAEEFQAAVVTNCEANLRNTQNLNAAVQGLIRSVEQSKTLTEAEKEERIDFYKQLLGEEPECPPR